MVVGLTKCTGARALVNFCRQHYWLLYCTWLQQYICVRISFFPVVHTCFCLSKFKQGIKLVGIKLEGGAKIQVYRFTNIISSDVHPPLDHVRVNNQSAIFNLPRTMIFATTPAGRPPPPSSTPVIAVRVAGRQPNHCNSNATRRPALLLP